MSGEVTTLVIFGHFFEKRLNPDLRSNLDSGADESYNLHGMALVFLHGIAGRTLAKLRSFDLNVHVRAVCA